MLRKARDYHLLHRSESSSIRKIHSASSCLTYCTTTLLFSQDAKTSQCSINIAVSNLKSLRFTSRLGMYKYYEYMSVITIPSRLDNLLVFKSCQDYFLLLLFQNNTLSLTHHSKLREPQNTTDLYKAI
jgi:hypothetical protein